MNKKDIIMIVRQAKLEDVKDITDIHCSNIDKWYKDNGDEKIEVPYEDISIYERFSHGGPWMSIDTCAVHINNMLLEGNYVLVAEEGKRVIGEIEIFIGNEPPPFGKNAHISVLFVHKEHQKKGIGTSLIEEAIQIANKCDCYTISTQPEGKNIDFYGKFDFVPFLKQVRIEINTEKYNRKCNIKEFESVDYEIVKDKVMIIGRYQSSKQMWEQNKLERYYAISEEFNILKNVKFKVKGKEVYVKIRKGFGKDKANIYAWADSSISMTLLMRRILNISSEMGFKIATFLIDEEIFKEIKGHFLFTKKEDQGLWVKRLK